jgi:hypothetical protein
MNDINVTAFLPITVADLAQKIAICLIPQISAELISAIQNEKENKLITTAELCAFFRITRGTLYNWEKAGLITPVRIGRNKGYRLNDILASGIKPISST